MVKKIEKYIMNKDTQESTSIAVINTNIVYIQRDISEIRLLMKDGYATKESLKEVATQTEDRLLRLEKSSNFWRWMSPSLAAVLGSVMTFLTINFLTK